MSVVSLGTFSVFLIRRVRIELGPDLLRNRPEHDTVAVAVTQSTLEALQLLVGQHGRLRKHEPEDRIVGNVVPVDELVHDVVVGLHRENVRCSSKVVCIEPGSPLCQDRLDVGRSDHFVLQRWIRVRGARCTGTGLIAIGPNT